MKLKLSQETSWSLKFKDINSKLIIIATEMFNHYEFDFPEYIPSKVLN